MVSARLVDCSDTPEEETRKPIPKMMFAAGEEPVGVRVLSYQSPGAIKRILKTLEADEVEFIRRSSFGKIVEIGDKPADENEEKHELWFRFAGKPVRFSLREFAIVTGLPCGKYPRKSKLKLKESICEKPYWPSLFGRREVVSVASVIKMLWRRTVKDREIRIKFSCLAILESVLLPTSLKMKICRDHAEAIENLEEFFSYPWGRLAFDMLVRSIRERDEVALSQNNIAVKGFALALQLVMVEAVSSLTEVVQDSCSASESDSDDDVGDPLWPKKPTLNPAHARNVDKKCVDIVRSIILEDPERPIDESSVTWSDEEEDETVSNMVDLINADFCFRHSMFVGGITKRDVDRIRESLKPSVKTKKSKQSASPVDVDTGCIASVVMEQVSPQLCVMETNIKEAMKKIDFIEFSVTAIVESMLKKFKDDLVDTVTSMVISAVGKGQPSADNITAVNPCAIPHCVSVNDPLRNPVLEANDKCLRNVMEHISDYSTPPTSPRNSQNTIPSVVGDAQKAAKPLCPGNHSGAQSAHSQNHSPHVDITQILVVDKMVAPCINDMPSFSLGLTQEENMQLEDERLPQERATVSLGDDIVVGDNMDDPQSSRKSKRQKTVPAALLHDYQCGPHILSRMRLSQKVVFVSYEQSELQRKYANLSKQLNRNIVIDVAGLSISSTDIQLLVQRSRHFPPKVVDILIRLVRLVVLQQPATEGVHNYYFLDSKFASALSRHYCKFTKSKNKEAYKFPKSLLGFFHDTNGSSLHRRRFYFPLNISQKHWVGICFDTVYGQLTVLDCNFSLFNEEAMEKRLSPFLHMLPYMFRQLCGEIYGEEVLPYTFDRPKSVSQQGDLPESGLMAVMFMVIHAVYGIDACKSITSDSLNEEAKCRGIMAFEFKEIL
ncbi:hypothetical protein Bca52824_089977 [Brassica carinata]|uniref:Ubiquitin-like protease family profile domain-containing protein n=1 Tax=Brassica carinata TaxID=52824 RepID=A0A8X7TEV9_BRACI|nr:hypothetical protein Bca52824_089977 [Brassica carinata]